MDFEKPKTEKDPEYIEKAEEMRKRVDALREGDSEYEDSVKKLAIKVNEHREKENENYSAVISKFEIIPDSEEKRIAMENAEKSIKENINKSADDYSTEVLESAENKKKSLENERKSFRDGLTGLRNKNAFIEEMPGFLRGSLREKEPGSMIMVDFDFFKKVNDTYGHEVGDQALKKLARILKEKVRESDFVYRYGGEEFAIFLPGTNQADAMVVAEKIRKAAEEAEIKIKSGDSEKILKKTVSLGVSGTEGLDNLNELLSKKELENSEVRSAVKEVVEKADRALYVSKGSDRNRATKYDKTMDDKPDDKEKVAA